MISGNAATSDHASAPIDYAYKPSLMGAPMEFHLADDALEWRRGETGSRMAYRDIRRIRLGFRPMTMQNHRFLTEVWPAAGPKVQIASTSWKSMFEQERLDAGYSAFVAELSRRIGLAGGATQFDTGSPALLFWPGVVIFTAATVSMAALAVRALQTGALAAVAFILGFLALFLWQGGNFFLRNRPGTFDPNAIPAPLLPGTGLIRALR
jgi:hypothetical protein